ncbi:ComEC/Rec2 family competence protein [bacterium]|nr:ComEC/Rec2 family competence protein [bacterium]NCS96924.1 ComEC/Rec2 family competence protein [bacterium]
MKDNEWGEVPIRGVVSKPSYENGLYQILTVSVKTVKQEVKIIVNRYPQYEYGDIIDIWQVPDKDMFLFSPKLQLVSHGGGNVFYTYIYKIRERLIINISTLYPEPYSRLILGIAFGVRMDLGDELEEQFSSAGVTHIMVASGYNVTVIVTAIWGVLSAIGVSKNVSRWISVGIILVFTVLAGLDPPVIRAAVMVLFLVAAEGFGRQYHPLLILCYVGIGMLVVNPLLVKSLSFYLSVGATGAIFVVRPGIVKYFDLWPSVIRDDLITTVSVSFITVPLLWVWLLKIQLTGLLTNLLILWTVPYITFGAVFSLIVQSVNMPLARFIAVGVTILLKYMLVMVEVVIK